MTDRAFHLRSRAAHDWPSNELTELALEIELDGMWQAEVLSTHSPPFRAFLCTLLMCQHAYLRMNAAERGLVLGGVRGELHVATDDWTVLRIESRFDLELRDGVPTDEDLSFIRERIEECPIARNLPNATKRTTLIGVPVA